MKKILNKIKQNTLGFILGAIVFSAIGVYAATLVASEIPYTNNEQENVQGAIDDLYQKSKIIKQGDYIRLTPTASTYTIAASETGYTEDQTINPSELTLWRVISVTTDGIEVVSDKVSSTNVTFGTGQSITTTAPTASTPSVIAYAKFIKTLNAIAAQYTDGVHVKSTRHMGYNSDLATEEITDTTSLVSTTAPWSGITGKNSGTIENLGGGDLGYNVDYNLIKKIYGTGKANKVGTTIATTYWLASRYYTNYDSTSWYLETRYVDNYGRMYGNDLYRHISSGWVFYSVPLAIRPILTLNPDITVASGTGSESDPYELN